MNHVYQQRIGFLFERGINEFRYLITLELLKGEYLRPFISFQNPPKNPEDGGQTNAKNE